MQKKYIWRELILADRKLYYIWREVILADFGGFLTNPPNPPKFLPAKISSLKVLQNFFFFDRDLGN